MKVWQILLFVISVGDFKSQPINSGIFYLIPCSHNTKARTVTMSPKEKVCLANEPILSFQDFQHVSDLRSEAPYTFFYLTLSENGFQMLQRLSDSLLASRLALVLEDEVTFIIDLSKAPTNNIIKFQVEAHLVDELRTTHAKITKLIGSK